MQISNSRFQKLPFSRLFKTYINDFSKLDQFYSVNPFDDEALAEHATTFQFPGDRRQSVELLTAFNDRFDVEQATLDNVNRLKQKDALAVVTGQQLGIYGGPLYTIFKTLATIHLSKKLEQRYDRPVIPVFWLADEDHDYDEVKSIHILNDDQLQEYKLPATESYRAPVAEQRIPREIDEFRRHLKDSLYETEFSEDLWALLDACFGAGTAFSEAFGNFLSRLFSKHGLVLAGSNTPEMKQAAKGCLKQSVKKADDIYKQLQKQTQQLKQDYHQQVTLYESNLFYLDEEVGRLKIEHQDDDWQIENGQSWKPHELLDEIDDQPHKFSPNVFLRPLLQDMLLPTFGYVAGPGELAYYGQMKKMYASFNLDMPVIFPRLSGTLIEPAIHRIMKELPFDFDEYSHRIEDLESTYVNRSDHADIEALFQEWKTRVEDVAEPRKEKVSQVDPTLDGAAGKATAVYLGELDKLKGKVYRSVKKQDETQLKRIRRIKANLFPDNTMQERMIPGIFYMNKYGLDIWDKLLDSLSAQVPFNEHKLIYL